MAKFLIYHSILIGILTCDHEIWVMMTERTRSQIQAAEMGFLRNVVSISLRDKVRSSVICESLSVELILFLVEGGS